MLGGGFLKQGADSAKLNRDWLKSATRRADTILSYDRKEKREQISVELPALSDAERAFWQEKLKRQQRRESLKKKIIMITSVVATFMIMFYLYAEVFGFLRRIW